MPLISTFYGILIKMFFNDHAPPHFHAEYGDFKATINIQTLALMEGDMPRRALNLTLDWAELHQAELLEDWRLCELHQQPRKIQPLE